MSRLIDANVVLANQFAAGLSDASGNYYGHADVVFVDDIENAPTVDAVEVVRCKDCKCWLKFESSLIGEVMCCTGQGSINILKSPYDFCSCGKRKDGDSE